MKLLLQRHGNGIGDWLFMLAALKHVQRDYPSIELVVDFDQAKNLPPLVVQAYEAADVAWIRSTGQACDRRIQHVIYPHDRYAAGEHYVKGMVDQIARILGVKIAFDPDLLPRFRTSSNYVSHGGHVLIGAGPKLAAKDWGRPRFQELALEIAASTGLAVVSIGGARDRPLEGMPHFHGKTFDEVAGAIASCRCLVTGENGLAVLAAFLRRPCVVIYRRGDLRRLDYPGLEKTLQPDVFHVRRLVEGALK